MPTTQILDVPSEILGAIIADCIETTSCKRAFRLRLVCRAFDHVFQNALFQTQAFVCWAPLDDPLPWDKIQPLAYWQTRTENSAQKAWHSYLVYMVQGDINPSVPYVKQTPDVSWCAEVREIAQLICNKAPGSDLHETIDALCWLGFGGELGGLGNFWPNDWYAWYLPKEPRQEARQDINLLSAAAYLNHLPLAKALLQKYIDPSCGDLLFPAPMEAAARAGNIEMLQLFQESLADRSDMYERYYVQHSTMGHIHCRGKADPQAVAGAAARGDLEVLEMALYPPSRKDTAGTDYFGQSYGNVEPNSHPGQALRAAMLHSRSWEVYARLASFFHEFYDNQPVEASLHLQIFAEFGNLEIVRNLLERGVVWHGDSGKYLSSIHAAARHGRHDMVDLLLQYGANINRPGLYGQGLPLNQAVLSRRISLVKKMLDLGAVCEFETLQTALFSEYPAMAELVLAHYPTSRLLFGGELWKLLARARSENYAAATKSLKSKIPGLISFLEWIGALRPKRMTRSN